MKSWFTVTVSKKLHGQSIEIDMTTNVRVLAYTPSDAMKTVRAEFRNFYLSVKAEEQRYKGIYYYTPYRSDVTIDELNPDEGDKG